MTHHLHIAPAVIPFRPASTQSPTTGSENKSFLLLPLLLIVLLQQQVGTSSSSSTQPQPYYFEGLLLASASAWCLLCSTGRKAVAWRQMHTCLVAGSLTPTTVTAAWWVFVALVPELSVFEYQIQRSVVSLAWLITCLPQSSFPNWLLSIGSIRGKRKSWGRKGSLGSRFSVSSLSTSAVILLHPGRSSWLSCNSFWCPYRFSHHQYQSQGSPSDVPKQIQKASQRLCLSCTVVFFWAGKDKMQQQM